MRLSGGLGVGQRRRRGGRRQGGREGGARVEEGTRESVSANGLGSFARRLFVALELEGPDDVLADGLDVGLVVELQELPERGLVFKVPDVLLSVPLDQLFSLGAFGERLGLLEVVLLTQRGLVVLGACIGRFRGGRERDIDRGHGGRRDGSGRRDGCGQGRRQVDRGRGGGLAVEDRQQVRWCRGRRVG